MGWCSGTVIFDAAARGILASSLPEDEQAGLLVTIINALWDQDWDCEWDSDYMEEPAVRKAFTSLREDFFDDEEWEDED